jgi:hypothetical protein
MIWSSAGSWRARLALAGALLLLTVGAVLLAATRLSIEGRWRGLFLLTARDGRPLELRDDLYLGDAQRLVAGVSFDAARRWLRGTTAAPIPGQAALEVDFDEASGRGLVHNWLGDGRELVTIFGRYVDDEGGRPQGLFVGGATTDVAADFKRLDDSGMALHDARGWIHVWCSVNEAIWDREAEGIKLTYPSSWRFLGSRILSADRSRVVLQSSHELTLQRGKLRMDRVASFVAGEPFFRLEIKLTGLGPQVVRYGYVYGDEPWVGHFGSADGNVGWVDDAVVLYEGRVDPVAHRWAGILDLKSGVADYIEWVGPDVPDDAYFSNTPGDWVDAAEKKPLASNQVFVGMQWLGRRLAPGEGRTMGLLIGLAEADPITGRPRRPVAAAQAAAP